jgi:hypothetical protein
MPCLTRELRLLERRTHRSGKDSVDHGAGGSDDHANVVFGACWLALQPREGTPPWATTYEGVPIGACKPKGDPNVANSQSPACLIDFKKFEKPAQEGITRRVIGAGFWS